jgi:HD-GYP domain-containing protein (c-di-GMP phosphodiesterase class II)
MVFRKDERDAGILPANTGIYCLRSTCAARRICLQKIAPAHLMFATPDLAESGPKRAIIFLDASMVDAGGQTFMQQVVRGFGSIFTEHFTTVDPDTINAIFAEMPGCRFLTKGIVDPSRIFLIDIVMNSGKTRLLSRMSGDLMWSLDSEHGLIDLARRMESHDSNTKHHCDRLALYSGLVADGLHLSEHEVHALYLASLLHDLGKVGIPASILTKTDPLTEQDWQLIKFHPELGVNLITPFPEFRAARNIILCHHEQWNGNGYPANLSGEKIPYLARVFQVIDAYDALTSNRPYKAALSHKAAATLLTEETAQGRWDPALLPKIIAILEKHLDFIQEHLGQTPVEVSRESIPAPTVQSAAL